MVLFCSKIRFACPLPTPSIPSPHRLGYQPLGCFVSNTVAGDWLLVTIGNHESGPAICAIFARHNPAPGWVDGETCCIQLLLYSKILSPPFHLEWPVHGQDADHWRRWSLDSGWKGLFMWLLCAHWGLGVAGKTVTSISGQRCSPFQTLSWVC